MLDGLAKLLQTAAFDRLVIAGGPRVGKSILAEKLAREGVRYHHGEELKDRPEWAGLTKSEKWAAGSLLASHWLDEPGPWLCENVAMPRALRKWLARNPEGKPTDAALWLAHPVAARKRGQHVMAVGCATVWRQVAPALRDRGVVVLEAEESEEN